MIFCWKSLLTALLVLRMKFQYIANVFNLEMARCFLFFLYLPFLLIHSAVSLQFAYVCIFLLFL